jgi:hypothetical protein
MEADRVNISLSELTGRLGQRIPKTRYFSMKISFFILANLTCKIKDNFSPCPTIYRKELKWLQQACLVLQPLPIILES